MRLAALCGCGCWSVVTFDSQEGVQVNSDNTNGGLLSTSAADGSSPSAEALLLVFQRLSVHELCGSVPAVSRPWQSAAAAALTTQLISVGILKAGSAKAASFAAWIARYSTQVQDLHIHHADIGVEEWTSILSCPYPKLSRLELNRCRLTTSELLLVMQLTGLKELTLNSISPQPEVRVIQQLSSSLKNLTKLELKSCDLGGEHLQGLTPLVQANLASLNLFDNPGIGTDIDSSNKALNMWGAALGCSNDSMEALSEPQESGQIQIALTAEPTHDTNISSAVQVEQQLDKNHEQSINRGPSDATNTAAESAQSLLEPAPASNPSSTKDSLDGPQHQQQLRCPVFAPLHELQLGYCRIQHLPALSQLTSLTSLDLRENRCDGKTVQAIGQLQQLQELVLEEAVAPNIPPAAYAALSALTNLELLDISGGPAGCLDVLLELPAGITDPPAPSQEKTAAVTNGWHGLRVRWSGKGRPPLGFRLPGSRRSSSVGRSSSSPRVSRDSCRTSRDSMSVRCSDGPRGTSDSVLEAAQVVGVVAAREHTVTASEAQLAVGPKELEERSLEAGPHWDGCLQEKTSALQLSPAQPNPASPEGGDLVHLASAAGNTAGEPLSSICEPTGSNSYDLFPRLQRLEAEQLGLTDADVAAIVRCCSQLQELDISGNRVGPEGISKLRELTTLTHLNISMQQPALADTAAGPLMQLRNLKGLDVGGNTFSRAVEVQLQREGSGGGGRLTRLTGCGMRSEVHEPWVHIMLGRHQQKHLDKTVGGLHSPKAVRSMSLDSTPASPRNVKAGSISGSTATKQAGAQP